MRAIPYMNARIYNVYLLALHRKNLDRRYRFISKEIGKEKTLFEPGCGTGFLTHYLDKSCRYIGWDLNPAFIKYLRKRGVKAELKDMFDFKDYPENDVTVMVDILHHVTPKEKKLIENALKSTKKLIVVEPYRAYRINKDNAFSHLYYLYDIFLGDNDGINPLRNRVLWNFSKESLKNYFNSLGVSKIKCLGKDVIAIWVK